MTWKPHATVAVIVEQDGRFLMVEERSAGAVVFNQPAGHVEEDESLFDAALRETLEETGYAVELQHFIGIYTFRAPRNGVTYYRFCFSGEAIERQTQELDDDIIAAHWLDLDQIHARETSLRSPLVLACIEDYLHNRHYPLELIREFS